MSVLEEKSCTTFPFRPKHTSFLTNVCEKLTYRHFTITPIFVNGELYSKLIGEISHRGLRLTRQRRELENRTGKITSVCKGLYTPYFGTSCWHGVKDRIETRQLIVPYDFNPHWHLNRPQSGCAYAGPTCLTWILVLERESLPKKLIVKSLYNSVQEGILLLQVEYFVSSSRYKEHFDTTVYIRSLGIISRRVEIVN